MLFWGASVQKNQPVISRNHIWCHHKRTSSSTSKTEVQNFQSAVRSYNNIGWFKITMNNASGVEVFYSTEKLIQQIWQPFMIQIHLYNLFACTSQTVLCLHMTKLLIYLDQGFPTFLWPCTPSAFWNISMYPFSISTDEYVPLKFLMTKYFIMINHRYM